MLTHLQPPPPAAGPAPAEPLQFIPVDLDELPAGLAGAAAARARVLAGLDVATFAPLAAAVAEGPGGATAWRAVGPVRSLGVRGLLVVELLVEAGEEPAAALRRGPVLSVALGVAAEFATVLASRRDPERELPLP